MLYYSAAISSMAKILLKTYYENSLLVMYVEASYVLEGKLLFGMSSS
jgi:hypothetical protein